jgi:hypothetical protein
MCGEYNYTSRYLNVHKHICKICERAKWVIYIFVIHLGCICNIGNIHIHNIDICTYIYIEIVHIPIARRCQKSYLNLGGFLQNQG